MSQNTWRAYAEQTLETCTKDPSFGGYTAREKMLAYCYTLLETMKSDKDIVAAQWRNWIHFLRSENYKAFKKAFNDFSDVLIQEGIERAEIQARPFISGIYSGLIWAAVLAIITFWVNDKSDNTEQTDVAVEKFVHLVFDAIAPNAVDSALDVLQFLVKQRLNG
jgi:hypothetical protein